MTTESTNQDGELEQKIRKGNTELVESGIRRLPRHAHEIDIRIRDDGQDRWQEGDWLKYLPDYISQTHQEFYRGKELKQKIRELLLDGADSSDWQDRALLASPKWEMPMEFMVSNIIALISQARQEAEAAGYERGKQELSGKLAVLLNHHRDTMGPESVESFQAALQPPQSGEKS